MAKTGELMSQMKEGGDGEGWRMLMEEGGEDFLEKELEEQRKAKEIEKERIRVIRGERRRKKEEKERRKNERKL